MKVVFAILVFWVMIAWGQDLQDPLQIRLLFADSAIQNNAADLPIHRMNQTFHTTLFSRTKAFYGLAQTYQLKGGKERNLFSLHFIMPEKERTALRRIVESSQNRILVSKVFTQIEVFESDSGLVVLGTESTLLDSLFNGIKANNASRLISYHSPVLIQGQSAKASASSTRMDAATPQAYSPANAFDGDFATAWVEGSAGIGAGDWLQLEFSETQTMLGMVLYPGYLKTFKTLIDNATPDSVEIQVDGKVIASTYVPYRKVSEYYGKGNPTMDSANLAPRILLFGKEWKGKTLRLRIIRGNYGSRFKDMAISELQPILANARQDGYIGHAIKVLQQIQKGDTSAFEQAAATTFTDIRRMLAYDDTDAGIQYVDSARLPKDQHYPERRSSCSGSSLECWVQSLQSTMVHKFVSVIRWDSHYVMIGDLDFHAGVSGTLSVYPGVILGANGGASRFKEFFWSGCAPFCYRLIPDQDAP